MIEAFEIGVALALETGDAQSALSGLAAQLSTLDQQMTDVQSRISQSRAGSSGFVAPEKLPAFENAPRQDIVSPVTLTPFSMSSEPKRPLQSEAGNSDLVQPPLLTWFDQPPQRAEAGASAQATAPVVAVPNDDPGRGRPEVQPGSKPDAAPLAVTLRPDMADTASYGATQMALADALGIVTKAAPRNSEDTPQSRISPNPFELAPPRLQSFAVLPTHNMASITSEATDDTSRIVSPSAANPERASVLGGHGEPALAAIYELLQRAQSSASELQTPALHEATSALVAQRGSVSGDVDAPNLSRFQAFEASLPAQESARAGVVMPVASDLAPEWQMTYPQDKAVTQVSSSPLYAAITLPPSLTPAGRLPMEAGFEYGGVAARQFGAVPVPPTFSPAENRSATRAGPDPESQANDTNSTRSERQEREDQRDSPIVIHTNVHVDGEVVARAVTDRIFAALNGPLTGTGGFDSRRSYTPVES